ncbi:MAG: hypothetical protein K5839_05375 [Treponemataceae bacterium]|nr:hypothetical protein [Treponemataceae bacterium]
MSEKEKGKYEDIIYVKWPRPDKLGWMTLNNRAKIFIPFAALKGFEEEIEMARKKSDLDF